ncbi:rhodanese-like domain-containing protein [Nafulsella turpanensis]|uniref:rhodanese-like domain-containing protein n=1 Tax=Nafulsella turpanensis TaxID=1265690 RepID=UPI00034AA82D|nr:rhodanese-like domain-containing protein [Nafulsella turpanensis]
MNYENIKAEEFKNMIEENPNMEILDVRTAGELAQGIILGASNIDIMDSKFADKISKLPKDKPYMVYCRSGARSAQACEIMSGKDFGKLYNLSGGISRWPYEAQR